VQSQPEAPEPRQMPTAHTEATPPPQETQPGSADTRQEAESSEAGTGIGGTAVTLPALGESVTEGTVTRWLKQVGDDVAVDEPLLEVSTDKVDTEIPSPVAGKLMEIRVQEDETVEVGAELALIGSGEPSTSAGQQSAPSQGAPSQGAPSQGAPSQGEEQDAKAAAADAPTGDGVPSAGSQADASQTAPATTPPAAHQVDPNAGAESDGGPGQPQGAQTSATPAPQQAPQQPP
jgi:pyruvate dehydrogenase E2 component (dihydrolipoamide acetyltransferase)